MNGEAGEKNGRRGKKKEKKKNIHSHTPRQLQHLAETSAHLGLVFLSASLENRAAKRHAPQASKIRACYTI